MGHTRGRLGMENAIAVGMNPLAFRFACSPSPYFRAIIFLLCLAPATLLLAQKAEEPGLMAAFENVDPEVSAEGMKIISECARRFREVTHHKAGDWTVRVCFVEKIHAHGMNLCSHGQLRGVTRHGCDGSTIQIATRLAAGQRSSWERVLAHEVVHALVREAYGNTSNTTLNEGLAEYIAGQMFPSEVRRDLHNAVWGASSQALIPYVEGHRFCSEHGEEKDFADFFAKAIKTNDIGYDGLAHEWQELSTSNIER